MLLRAANPPQDLFFRLSRQKIFLFLAIAAWAHLGFFVLFAKIGASFNYAPPIPQEALGLPLELVLELNEAPAPPLPRPEPPLRPLSPPPALPAPPLNIEPAPELGPDETLAGFGLASPLPPDPPMPPGFLAPDPQAPPPAMDAATQELIDSLDNEVKTFALARSAPILDDGAYPLLAPAPEGPDNTVSVEESAPNAKSYDVTVRTAVARRWLLPPEARANFQPGRFTASMTLNPSGELILIVVDESTGNQALDYAAMEALRGAAPYEPFPPELRHLESMTFRVNFDYRAVARRGLPQG